VLGPVGPAKSDSFEKGKIISAILNNLSFEVLLGLTANKCNFKTGLRAVECLSKRVGRVLV